MIFKWIFKKQWIFLCAIIVLCCLCSGCTQEKAKAVYVITAEGSVQESGVISFVGFDMNVYPDYSSNPCGDCENQPISIYVGADSKETVQAMGKLVTRANDVWEVVSCTENTLILQEKEACSQKEPDPPTGPAGITFTGTFHQDGQVENLQGASGQKIAAIYGPTYEAVVALGAEDRIVICSDVQVESFPWAQKIFKRMNELPYLKNVHSSVNVESLKKYHPDVVFTFSRPNELKQMEAAGLLCIGGKTPQNLQETKRQLKPYAELLGEEAQKREQQYETYFDEKLARIKSVTDQIPVEQRPKVYYAGVDLLTTYGKYTDINEAIEAAGGISVTKDLEAGNHTQINFEQLAVYNPDYIFIDHGGMNERETVEDILQEAYHEKHFQAIHAVADKNVYLCPSGVFYWDMGIQKILLIMYMAKELHPHEFADLDMVQEIQEFYNKFFQYDLTEKEAEKILHRQNP